jgi:hypothetical protein
MTTDSATAMVATASIATTTLSDSVRWRIFLYLGVLIMLMDFGAPFGGLFYVPISFFLKNKLHLEAHEASEFKLISSIPLCLSFLFGFARDTWNPFGMRDRGVDCERQNLGLHRFCAVADQKISLTFALQSWKA